MLCALIMAGGKGTRFWPLSTEDKPKQFLKLLSDETMIQMTVKRLLKVIPLERIFVVTGEKYVSLVKEQLPELPDRNIIIEPEGRNTAPCIALSAFIIKKYYEDASIAVLPSDHLINDEEEFARIISTAGEFVEEKKDAVVTLGMKPTRPETGYGYIKTKAERETVNSYAICKVDEFVEKPSLDKAMSYIKQGIYLWNGGMFIWKADTILKLSKEYIPRTYAILEEMVSAPRAKSHLYKTVESISVDYAIMEKTEDIYVIPCDFGWDDIGTWSAVERYREKDANNNITSGEIKAINAQGNMIISNNKPIIIVGLEDVFCVETEELILIGKKEDMEKIKEIKKLVD